MYIYYNIDTKEVSDAHSEPYTYNGRPGVPKEGLVELEVVEIPMPEDIPEGKKAIQKNRTDIANNKYIFDWSIIDE